MIYQAILKIKGKEIPLLYYSYQCHLRHCDDPNLRRIIQLHIEACEKTGNREYLPVEGDLIMLMFECSGDEQLFYDWLNVEGTTHYGEIHFIYNEVEVVDIFRFGDCFCLKIEESMSAVNSPMVMTVYLSPGIIKRNNLEAREKEWKVSENLTHINFNAIESDEFLMRNNKTTNSVSNQRQKQELEEQELKTQSKEAWKRAEKINLLLPPSNRGKTICSDGIVTVSGYSKERVSKKFRKQVPNFVDVPVLSVIEEALKLNHKLHENSSLDNGLPGSSSASHAEKQMLVIQNTDIAIGVNRKMCDCCKKFIQKLSNEINKTIYITTPPGLTEIYTPSKNDEDESVIDND